MNCFDPLEETVAADNINGRNDCPIQLRITALWQKYKTSAERWTFQNGGALKEGFRAQEKRAEGRPAIIGWIEIDGEIYVGPMKSLAELIGAGEYSLHSKKSKATKLDPKATEATMSGYRFGWDTPPNTKKTLDS